MSGALSLSNYYIKCRIGPNSSSLSEGQTYNQQTPEWLNDTDAWIRMPQIPTDASGNWQGSIQCRVKISAVDESKVIYIRACLSSNSACGTSFQSSAFLTVNTILPTPTPTLAPTDTPVPTNAPTNTPAPTTKPASTPTPKPTAKPTQKLTPTISKDFLATSSEVLGESSESAEPTRKPQKTEVLSSKSHNIIPIVLIFLGIVFLIACVAVFSYPYIIRFINKNKDE
jgi:hypothetical protein